MDKHGRREMTLRVSEDHYERLREITFKLRISKQDAMNQALEMWLKIKEDGDVKTRKLPRLPDSRNF